MNNDLISREALKEALSDKELITWTHEYGDAIPFDWLMSAIDNAPTVDNPYQEGHIDGMLQAEKLYARPIGEWKFNVKWQDYECPFCNEWVRPNIGGLPNFCPNCGADMKDGAE